MTLETPLDLLTVFLVLEAGLELLSSGGDRMAERPARVFLWSARVTGRDGEAEYRKLIEEVRERDASCNARATGSGAAQRPALPRGPREPSVDLPPARLPSAHR